MISMTNLSNEHVQDTRHLKIFLVYGRTRAHPEPKYRRENRLYEYKAGKITPARRFISLTILPSVSCYFFRAKRNYIRIYIFLHRSRNIKRCGETS